MSGLQRINIINKRARTENYNPTSLIYSVVWRFDSASISPSIESLCRGLIDNAERYKISLGIKLP
jgi:hypothetical protein